MTDWSRRDFMATTAAATVLGATALPGTSQAAPLVASQSGLPWASGATTDTPDAFAAMRGRKLDILTTFVKRNTWTTVRNIPTAIGYIVDPKKSVRNETVVITYPMFPDAESPKTGGAAVWQRAAVGEFDAHHIAVAQGLTRFPQRFIFRIGHEWNCCYPWACFDPALAPYYKDYFRRIVDILRAYHPTCLIDWCSVKKGKTTVSIDYFYPGNDWVDIIAHDRYDMWLAMRTDAEWNKEYTKTFRTGPQGLGTWLAYAKSKGKRLGISEWGVVNGPVYPGGGGDNAYFISRMFQFFKDNAADIAYESYFDRNAAANNWYHKLTSDHNPQARAAYQAFLAAQP